MRIYSGETVQGYYSYIPNHIRSEVESMDDEEILGIDEEEYVEYLFEKYSLEPLEKDDSRKTSVEKLKDWRETEGIIGSVRTEIFKLKIGYPITITAKTAEVFEMGWGILPMRVHEWELDTSSGCINAIVDNSQDAIRNELRLLDQVISNKNNLIQENNPSLKSAIRQIVDNRKKKVIQDKEHFKNLVNEIDIPLEVVNKNAVKPINFGIKAEMKILIPPKPKVKDEYVLDRNKVLTIIEIINNVAANFEVAPDTYNRLGEEDLRNIILSSLNSVFAGKATGETFRKKGKTDILLNIEQGCILVMECKWWNGEKTLQEAIEQLFKYLTWRENHGIIILFVKNKGFTKVLSSVEASIMEYPSHERRIEKLSESHFESYHIFPEDEEKSVAIHSLVYNLYGGEDGNNLGIIDH